MFRDNGMNRIESRLRETRLVLMILVLLPFYGCGFKDKPVPPQYVVPKAIGDLQAKLDEQGATLSWTYPRETVTGRDIDMIDGFALYRAEIPINLYCPSCPVPYDTPIDIAGGSVPPKSAKKAIHEIKNLRPGMLYFFKVRSRTGWWNASQDSNQVSFLWQIPPLPPDRVSVTSGDGENILQWQPVTRLHDNSRATVPMRYQLYRSVDDGPVTAIGEPLTATAYTDRAVENGKVYAYQVQAISVYEQGTMTSGLSEMMQAHPLDRTAPPVPGKVEGVRTEVGVKVYWEHVATGDLAGYRVYRRTPGESRAVLAGAVYLPYNIYIDAKAPAGQLLYSISSIDSQSPANESARSAEIRIDN